jgi:glycosyltransferase involved in cell wall biosynthesis
VPCSKLSSRSAFSKEKPSLLLANGHKGALFLALLHTFWPPARTARYAIFVRDFDYYWLGKILKRLPGCHLLAPSQAVFESERYKAWGIDRFPQTIIENAAELSTQEPVADEGWVGLLARLVPWKGVEFAIRAMRIVTDKIPNAKLRIYGEVIDKEYVASLRALVAELKLDGHIEFHEHTRDVASVYRNGAMFLVTSLNQVPGPEAFGRVVIEAWSHRRPVIAFDCGGPKHLIEDGEDGYLVHEKDTAVLAEDIVELLDNAERRRAFGEAGYAKVRDRFNPATLAGRLLETLFPDNLAPKK